MYYEKRPQNKDLTLDQVKVAIGELRGHPAFRNFQMKEHDEIKNQLEYLYERQSTLEAARHAIPLAPITSRLSDIETERINVRKQITSLRAQQDYKDWNSNNHSAGQSTVDRLYEREVALAAEERSLKQQVEKLPKFDPNKAFGEWGRRASFPTMPVGSDELKTAPTAQPNCRTNFYSNRNF